MTIFEAKFWLRESKQAVSFKFEVDPSIFESEEELWATAYGKAMREFAERYVGRNPNEGQLMWLKIIAD